MRPASPLVSTQWLAEHIDAPDIRVCDASWYIPQSGRDAKAEYRSHGTGADVMKRIAAPMVGGVITSTISVLVVYPAIYYLWRSRRLLNGGRKLETETKA